jgi:hypothetical protein
MEKLQYIYLALKKRIKEYKSKNYTDKEIEIELRLDIENCINLIAEELSITLEKDSES